MKYLTILIAISGLSSCAILLKDQCKGNRSNGYGTVSDLKAKARYKNTLLFNSPAIAVKVNNYGNAMFKNVKTTWIIRKMQSNDSYRKTVKWSSTDTLFSKGCIKKTIYLDKEFKNNVSKIELIKITADRL